MLNNSRLSRTRYKEELWLYLIIAIISLNVEKESTRRLPQGKQPFPPRREKNSSLELTPSRGDLAVLILNPVTSIKKIILVGRCTFRTMDPSLHLPKDTSILGSTFTNRTTTPRFLLPSLSNNDVFDYNGYASFAATLQDNLNTGREVLEFSDVTAEDFRFLTADNNRPLKSARFSYNFPAQSLTIRMPHFAHEIILGLFKALIDSQLFAMGVSDEFMPLVAPLTVLGNWTKEPDACWVPESVNDPTVVLEVGVSESSRRLAIDARGWLETPGTTVKACITIYLGRANNIIIDVWNLGRRTYTVSSRNQPSLAVRVQHVEIYKVQDEPQIRGWRTSETSAGTICRTDEIRLDFGVFIGRQVATDQERDVVINKDDLATFAERVWCHLRRRSQGC